MLFDGPFRYILFYYFCNINSFMLNKINIIITEVENAIASSKEQVEEYRIKWLSKRGLLNPYSMSSKMFPTN